MIPKTGAKIAPRVFTNGNIPIFVITATHRPPIIKPKPAVISPPILKFIFPGIKFAKSYAGGIKLATILIPTVAEKNANAATTVKSMLSTFATISVG